MFRSCQPLDLARFNGDIVGQTGEGVTKSRQFTHPRVSHTSLPPAQERYSTEGLYYNRPREP